MNTLFQGIPNLPDLTHPDKLMAWGEQIFQFSILIAILIACLGIILALLNWSNRGSSETATLLQSWIKRYFEILDKVPHFILIFILVVTGFFLCTTLANRYHHWEQARVSEIANTVSGERLEQPAPKIRYQIPETYKNYQWIDGRQVETEHTHLVDRFLNVSSSNIEVKINQTQNPENLNWLYSVDLVGEYRVINSLSEEKTFFFEMYPPYGYSLLQNFQVEQDGIPLKQVNPGDYGFPFRLAPGAETQFRVIYQAQGSPRWVYNPQGQLLSNLKLSTFANFPKADFAGAIPTETQEGGNSRRFTWIFEGNVSVRNPFGVFTATERINNTGIMPRLLLLAPAIFLAWILLLSLSLPLHLRDIILAGGIFFAYLLALTYSSRFLDVRVAWLLISPIFLGLTMGLGRSHQAMLGVLICTLAGVIVPVLGLIVPYSGFTLSLAGLMGAGWLSVRHWYGKGIGNSN